VEWKILSSSEMDNRRKNNKECWRMFGFLLNIVFKPNKM